MALPPSFVANLRGTHVLTVVAAGALAPQPAQRVALALHSRDPLVGPRDLFERHRGPLDAGVGQDLTKLFRMVSIALFKAN